MRTLLPAAILLLLATIESPAQPACPDLHFNAVPSASLNPNAATRLNLVRQSDGSYTSYETANTSPYRLVSASPDFEEQLTACLPAEPAAQTPAPAAPANPVGSPSQTQAVALLSSGNYLVVTPNSSGGIDAAVFGPQMNLVSVTSYAVSAQQLALADLNGDGNPDIVFVASPDYAPGQLTILLGKGGSTFQPFGSYSIPPIPVGLNSFAIADLNGDGKLDVAVAVAPLDGGGSIMTFLGNGDGMFQSGPALTLTGPPISVAIADLNGDGKPDLAVAASAAGGGVLAGSVAVALGNGDGSFGTPSYVSAAGTSLAIGDMNADGNPDIVTSSTILFGDGTGAFPTRQDYSVPVNSAAPGSVILADFNGDGRLDIVTAGGTPALLTGLAGSTITVLFAQPDGTFFGPAVSIASGLSANSLIFDLRRADFNGDGIPDLAYAGDDGIGVMLGKGDGTFVSSLPAPAGLGWYLATGDFNRDGNQDIVALLPYLYNEPTKSSLLAFLAGNGDRTFQAPVMTSLADTPAAFAAADFNGDGKLDVAVMSSTESFGSVDAVIIYLGNGDGTFTQGESYPTGPGANWILAGDLNGDGTPDLVVTNAGSQTQLGNVSTFLGKGDGTFAVGTDFPLAVRNAEGYTGSMSLADFNQDGKLDLAVATNSGFVVLLGSGDGTFQAPLTNTLSAALAAADLNGDGIPDLIASTGVASSACLTGLCYLLGNGNGSFQAPVPINAVAGTALLIADVNRDGKPDLVSPASPLGFFPLLNLSAGAPFQIVSSASYAPGPVAADSFVSAFGTNLPASTAGLSILVKDSAGVSRPATALYASTTQINFVMPAGISTGLATVSIASPANATPLVAHVEIAPIAAGLFTLNAAGYAVLIDAQGNQSYQPVFSTQNGAAVATPINLGAVTGSVYLTLFGTGFDNSAMGGVSVAVAGQTATVTYAGPQGAAGLDQVNVLLPQRLSGSGDSPVVLSAPGSVANTVHITIQ